MYWRNVDGHHKLPMHKLFGVRVGEENVVDTLANQRCTHRVTWHRHS